MQYDKVDKKTKPYTDEKPLSRAQVDSKKVTVSRHDTTRTEETKETRYPNEQDIGRIVIEEVPEERETPRITKREEMKPRTTEVTVTSKAPVKEDVIKVGKLDVTDVQTKRVEERVSTYKERVEGARKVE